MVDAASTNGKAAPAVKTKAAFPQMDSAAKGWMPEEVQLLEVVGAIGFRGKWLYAAEDGGVNPPL